MASGSASATVARRKRMEVLEVRGVSVGCDLLLSGVASR
jgi:hypothetical protein